MLVRKLERSSATSSLTQSYLRVMSLLTQAAHSLLCFYLDLSPGDHHHADAGYSDVDRHGAADVSALRKLYLDCMAHGAPPPETDRRLTTCTSRLTNFFSVRSRLCWARQSDRF